MTQGSSAPERRRRLRPAAPLLLFAGAFASAGVAVVALATDHGADTVKGEPPVSRALAAHALADEHPIPLARDRHRRAGRELVDVVDSEAARPVRIRIPAIGVSTSIVPLRRQADGTMQTPADYSKAGWFEPGPEPGERGPAIVTAHVDSKSGPGAFYKLRRLHRGDLIRIVRADGTAVRYHVEGLERWPKSEFPTKKVFGKTRVSALRLVTCSGSFDTSSGHYVDNTIVYAVRERVRRPVAHASSFRPDDPGFAYQWNFAGPNGIRMPAAWQTAIARRAPGGAGATVAVLDTGLAYRDGGGYRRAPDLGRVVPGHDFVAGNRRPYDRNGHGTHVAGTIAEATDNGRGAAGIAYGARIMPVRVLDARGAGDARPIARGIRWAAAHGADVINMSFEFSPDTEAGEIEPVIAALDYARQRGVVVVASSGNDGAATVSYPARDPSVIAVGATTERGCVAGYSNGGPDLDVVAPGGGRDAADGGAGCDPSASSSSIYQQTFTYDYLHFGLIGGYHGTSMAAPHVAGTAALIVAAERRAGRRIAPDAVAARIERTARDRGPAGFDPRYGHGLLDAAAALR